MSDAVHLALLIGGFTLIAISIIAGTVLISQRIRQQSIVKQGTARTEPTTKAGIGTCIGSGMSIVGNIQCDGPAQVFGRIEGELRASDLLIGDGAQVEGNVIAQDVTVCGRVKGTIRAARVKLQDPARPWLVSGARARRRSTCRVLRRLARGDVLMAAWLDRIARSTRDLLTFLDTSIGKAGPGFKSLADAWADTTTAHSRLMLMG